MRAASPNCAYLEHLHTRASLCVGTSSASASFMRVGKNNDILSLYNVAYDVSVYCATDAGHSVAAGETTLSPNPRKYLFGQYLRPRYRRVASLELGLCLEN